MGVRSLYFSQPEREDSLLVSRKACSQTSRRASPRDELDDCQGGVRCSLRRNGESGLNPGSAALGCDCPLAIPPFLTGGRGGWLHRMGVLSHYPQGSLLLPSCGPRLCST